jgi:hypothetical protein
MRKDKLSIFFLHPTDSVFVKCSGYLRSELFSPGKPSNLHYFTVSKSFPCIEDSTSTNLGLISSLALHFVLMQAKLTDCLFFFQLSNSLNCSIRHITYSIFIKSSIVFELNYAGHNLSHNLHDKKL